MGNTSHTGSSNGSPVDDYGTRLRQTFALVMQEFAKSPAMTRLATNNFDVRHYKAVLRQIYHYTKDNPQIQALAAVHFRGDDRDLVRMFFRHATSEIGHDRMALNDLASLGGDIARIPCENALPATAAFNAYVFHQIQFGNPIGYLGYLYFLEFLPTSAGAAYMDRLASLGIPRSAMTFLLEHTTVDVHHNQLMARYVERLIHNDTDFEAVRYAMRVTARLYADMLLAAIEDADNPQDWGIAHMELNRIDPSLSRSGNTSQSPWEA